MSNLIKRLTEARATTHAGAVPKPVIIAQRTEDYWKCPHCNEEIHEKHTFDDKGVTFHSDCGGAIQLPPYDWSQVSPEWRALLQPKDGSDT